MEGWIKIHRKMLDWEWYGDINTKTLFLHLLLTANYEEKRWRGIVIQRGQLVTSVAALSTELGLSTQQIRTALSRLKSTNEITIKTTNKFTIISVCKYDSYQVVDFENNKQNNNQHNNQVTNEQQTNNKQITTTKEYKNNKKEINKEEKNVCSADKSATTTKFQKPKIEEIKSYLSEIGKQLDAQYFFDYYEANGWKVGKNSMKDWKATVRTWLAREKNCGKKENDTTTSSGAVGRVGTKEEFDNIDVNNFFNQK